MEKSKEHRPMKYKGVLSGEHQSFEETIVESLFFIGCIAFLLILVTAPMYALAHKNMRCAKNGYKGTVYCDEEVKEIFRIILFWSFVSIVSSIFIAIMFGILMAISRCFIHDKHVLSGAVVYGFPLGYFLAYNFVSLCFSSI